MSEFRKVIIEAFGLVFVLPGDYFPSISASEKNPKEPAEFLVDAVYLLHEGEKINITELTDNVVIRKDGTTLFEELEELALEQILKELH